jgi:hypothetical protein
MGKQRKLSLKNNKVLFEILLLRLLTELKTTGASCH